MKQTNNAIKFLLAQYRAIFKHAYLKGIVSAAVLTTGLAAGTANAANLVDTAWDQAFKDNNNSVTITGQSDSNGTDGKYQFIQVSGSQDLKGTITIGGGNYSDISDNFIKATTGDVTINGAANGTLVLDAAPDSTMAGGIALYASGTSAKLNVNLKTVDMKEGDIQLEAVTGNTTNLVAKNFLVGDGNAEGDGTKSVIYLGIADKQQSGGTINLGDSSSVFDIKSDGRIVFVHSSGEKTINADSISIQGGYISSENPDVPGAVTAKNTINTHTLSLKDKAALSVGNQAITLNLTSKDNVKGTGTVDATSEISIASKLTLGSGTLSIADGAKVYAENKTNPGTLTIGTTSSEATVSLSSNTLTGLLKGIEDNADSTSGAVVIDKSGSLNFTDSVDLADFKYNTGTAASGEISVTAGGVVTGKNVTVSKNLSGTATNLAIKAESLTLGSNDFDSSTATALGFSGAQTESITFLDKNSTFVLQDTITLQNITKDENGKVIANSDGSITGNAIVSGGKVFTIDGGIYNDSYDVTLASGSLVVSNTQAADKSSLTLTGDFILDNTKGGDNTIKVSGSNTTLDISNSNFDIVQGSNSGAFTVEGSTAKLIATGENINEILTADSSSNKASSIALKSGTLSVVSDVSLQEGQLISGSAAAGAIAFDTTSGGKLDVDGTLTITGTNGSLDIGAKGTITADSLRLQNIKSGSTTLAAGTYTVDSGLSTTNSTDKVILTAANLNLGQINEVTDANDPSSVLYYVGSAGGNVSTNLELGNTGALKVEAGTWNIQDLTLTSSATGTGVVTIGGADKLDATGNIITASVTGNKLTVNGSKVDVASNGTANFTEVYTKAAGAVNVDGNMTINGKHTASGENTAESFGVDLAKGSVVVNKGGSLTLGSDLLSAISITNSGASINTNAKFEDGFNVDSGKLILGFGSDVSISAAAMKDLRNKLDSNDDLGGGTINVGKATLAGLTDQIDETNNTLDWNKIDDAFKDAIEDYEQEELSKVTLVGIDSSTEIKGNFGSVASDKINAGGSVNVQGNLSLSNAREGKFATGNGGAVIGFNVAESKALTLNNGGEAGTVSLGKDAELNINNGETVLTGIAGTTGSDVALTNAKTTVNGNAKAAIFTTDAASDLVVTGDLETFAAPSSSVPAVEADMYTSTFAGKLTVGGKATFKADAELQADGNSFKDLTANTWLGVFGDTTATGTVTLKGSADIADNATLTANKVEFTGSVLAVGTDGSSEENVPSSTGYLDVGTLKATSGAVVFDPDYSLPTTLGAIDKFEGTTANAKGSIGGVIQTNLVLGQNTAVMVGEDASKLSLQEFIKQFQDANGALKADELGSILMLNSQVTLDKDQMIIVDSTKSGDEIVDKYGKVLSSYKTAIGSTTADLYLGKNSALIVNDTTLGKNADGIAIYFNESGASIKGASGSKIILAGDAFLDQDSIKLFEDADTQNIGVKVEGTKGVDDIRVETLNGLMYFDLIAGEYTGVQELQFDTTKAESAFLGASAPVRESLLSYASKTANYYAYVDGDAETAVPLVGDKANEKYVTVDKNGNPVLTQAGQDKKLNLSDYVAVDGVAYERAYNSFLTKVTRNSYSGVEADQAARMAAFGGAMQAALTAGASTYEAISGRMGVGAQTGSVTFADNGQGAGLWVTPIYKNHDSDGFEAQGLSYGADMDLYGVALGGDYTLANGLRVGAAFNVGSGDADGQGAGSAVSNDFDYYGFAVYGGYTMDKFSLVADASYTVVDNDLEANTAVEKLKSSTDTSILSVGVTAQYAFNFNSVDVTPHAGLRYSYLDMDDYTVNGEDDEVGKYAGDSMSVFSIPVGVTFSKEIVSGEWTVKPAFDLTLTANMGDDTTDGTMSWTGVNNLKTNVETEVIDSFTYGATLGVSAKSGNFSMGFGVNYTGASSADEYGVSANARFVF